MMMEKYIKESKKFMPISNQPPVAEFFNLYNNQRQQLKKIAVENKKKYAELKKRILRIGMMFPINSIINEKVKEFCWIPYRRTDGSISACEGVVEKWRGCPPHSPDVSKTIRLLKKAKGFLIVQFEGFKDLTLQKYINNFTLKVEEILKKKGYNILESYGAGPCRVCAKGCDPEKDCHLPWIRRFALESCGFLVNHLCKKASEFSIYGDNSWEIKWVRDWNLPTQDPETFKSVTGILIG